MRERWEYLGAWIALGFGAAIEGKRCYWFRRENIGAGGTTVTVPVEDFWSSAPAARPGASV